MKNEILEIDPAKLIRIVEILFEEVSEETSDDEAPTTPKESVRPVVKMTKADRKVKNQKLMRSINGKLAAATKATDKAKALVFLKDAQALCPVGWTGVQSQIERKYVALGLGN